MRLKSCQVCKKWSSQRTDHSGKRWAIFIFPLKMIWRGDHWMNFSHFLAWWNPTMLFIFYFFISSFPLTRIIQPHRTVVFIYTDTFWPRSCISSANSIFKSKSWDSLLNAYRIKKILTLVIFVRLTHKFCAFFLPYIKLIKVI